MSFLYLSCTYDSRVAGAEKKITVSEKANNFGLHEEPIASLTRANSDAKNDASGRIHHRLKVHYQIYRVVCYL